MVAIPSFLFLSFGVPLGAFLYLLLYLWPAFWALLSSEGLFTYKKRLVIKYGTIIQFDIMDCRFIFSSNVKYNLQYFYFCRLILFARQ